MQSASIPPASGDRIAVVDVLRAYSLFGIIVTHSVTGFLAGQPPSSGFHAVQLLRSPGYEP